MGLTPQIWRYPQLMTDRKYPPVTATSERDERIQSIQHILASIFASQRALKTLAPEFNWAGLGNLLGDFGELVAIDHYRLTKAPGGSDGFDAVTGDGQTVQIKTNYAATQIGFRGAADLLLVVGVEDDGSWREVYFGPFAPVREASRFSARDNKHMIAVTKLKQLVGPPK
jgi:hypothetical protein